MIFFLIVQFRFLQNSRSFRREHFFTQNNGCEKFGTFRRSEGQLIWVWMDKVNGYYVL